MATIALTQIGAPVQRNNPGVGAYGSRKAALAVANDVSEWVLVFGGVTVQISGATAFSVDIQRATETDQSDAVAAYTQTEAERTANYDWFGPSYVRAKLNSVTAGPATVRFSGVQ